MRLKNTLEYLGLWERLNNPRFKGGEFDPLLAEAGSNAFTMSPSRWVEITDAIKQNLIPAELTPMQTSVIYASEADVLNVALFGITAKTWRNQNPEMKGNIRDYASINELICLSNMENEWLKNRRIKIGYNHAVRDSLSVQLLEGTHQMNYIFRQ